MVVYHQEDLTGGERYEDTQTDLDFIKELHRSRSVVVYQIGRKLYQTVVTDYDFRRTDTGPNPDGSWDGTCITYLKRVA